MKNNVKGTEKSVRILGRQLGRVLTTEEMNAIAGATGDATTQTTFTSDVDHNAF